MSNLMSGGAMTRTSALSGLKRRLMQRKAGMAASFSTGTSAGRSPQVRGAGTGGGHLVGGFPQPSKVHPEVAWKEFKQVHT